MGKYAYKDVFPPLMSFLDKYAHGDKVANTQVLLAVERALAAKKGK